MKSADNKWVSIMGRNIAVKRLHTGKGGYAEMGTVVTCNLKGFLVLKPDADAVLRADNSGSDEQKGSIVKLEEEQDDPDNLNIEDLNESNSVPLEELVNQQYKIGELDSIPGLELGMRHARVGDIFRVRCTSRFAYGPAGRPSIVVDTGNGAKRSVQAIPPDSDLEYEVQITAHRKEGELTPSVFLEEAFPGGFANTKTGNKDRLADGAGLSHEELNCRLALTDLLLRKDAGNRWFSYQDYLRAAKCYSKGTKIADDYIKSTAPPAPVEGEEAGEGAKKGEEVTARADERPIVLAYISCLNNLAACYLHTGENLKAKEMCVKVLELDPVNTKALMRASKASIALHNFEEAGACLERVLQINEPLLLNHPSPATTTTGSASASAAAAVDAAKAAQAQLQKAQREYKRKAKKIDQQIAGKLFGTRVTSGNNGGVGGAGGAGAGVGEEAKASAVSEKSDKTDSSSSSKKIAQEVSASEDMVMGTGMETDGRDSGKEEGIKSPKDSSTAEGKTMTTTTTSNAAPASSGTGGAGGGGGESFVAIAEKGGKMGTNMLETAKEKEESDFSKRNSDSAGMTPFILAFVSIAVLLVSAVIAFFLPSAPSESSASSSSSGGHGG